MLFGRESQSSAISHRCICWWPPYRRGISVFIRSHTCIYNSYTSMKISNIVQLKTEAESCWEHPRHHTYLKYCWTDNCSALSHSKFGIIYPAIEHHFFRLVGDIFSEIQVKLKHILIEGITTALWGTAVFSTILWMYPLHAWKY